MDYFAGLDISMDETHVCVLDREGEVVRESKTVSTADAIAGELAKAPSCRRIVFETGRMAPIRQDLRDWRRSRLPCVARTARSRPRARGETRRRLRRQSDPPTTRGTSRAAAVRISPRRKPGHHRTPGRGC